MTPLEKSCSLSVRKSFENVFLFWNFPLPTLRNKGHFSEFQAMMLIGLKTKCARISHTNHTLCRRGVPAELGLEVYKLAKAMVTKYHTLGGLKTRDHFSGSGGCRSQTNVSSGAVRSEASVLD